MMVMVACLLSGRNIYVSFYVDKRVMSTKQYGINRMARYGMVRYTVLLHSGRYRDGLADLQQRGWDEDVAMSAMREADGNCTAALFALEEEDR